MRLHVRNTFLHVIDADEEAKKLSRSHSDSSFSGSYSSRHSKSPCAYNSPRIELQADSSRPSAVPQDDPQDAPRGRDAAPRGQDLTRPCDPEGICHRVFTTGSSASQPRDSSDSSFSCQEDGSGRVDRYSSLQVAQADSFGEVRSSNWTIGTDLHFLGQCRPCAWHWKPQGCLSGSECVFCHLCPEGTVKLRRKEHLATLNRDKQVAAAAKAAEKRQRRVPQRAGNSGARFSASYAQAPKPVGPVEGTHLNASQHHHLSMESSH